MDSVILKTATRLISALMLVFSFFLLLRGHNLPGGGFIGSLVAATAFALYAIAFGPASVRQALRVEPMKLSIAGLGIALVAGLLALLEGAPFLTGVWNKIELEGGGTIPLGSPLLFDVGVYLVVLGAVLTLILAMEEEEGS